MSGTNSRQSLVTAVSIKRTLSLGFWIALVLITVLAVAAAGVAWHSEQQHRRAKNGVRNLNSEFSVLQQQITALQKQNLTLADDFKQEQVTLERMLASGPELRQRWLAGRVNDAVSVAEQALALNQNVTAAQQSLSSADRLLAEQPVAALLPLRRALQQDLTALTNLQAPDTTGIYIRLQVLDKRLGALDLPRQIGPQGDVVQAAVPAKQASAWRTGLAKFRELIVIRHYDKPLEPLLDDAHRQLVHEQLSLTISQAELALLRGQGVLYRAALESLSLRLQRDLGTLPHATLAPLLNELAALQAVDVDVAMPHLNSRAALDALTSTSGALL